MAKCDFNKVAKQLHWNHSSAWVFSCKFTAYFKNTFSKDQLWMAASDYLNLSITQSLKIFKKIYQSLFFFTKPFEASQKQSFLSNYSRSYRVSNCYDGWAFIASLYDRQWLFHVVTSCNTRQNMALKKSKF